MSFCFTLGERTKSCEQKILAFLNECHLRKFENYAFQIIIIWNSRKQKNAFRYRPMITRSRKPGAWEIITVFIVHSPSPSSFVNRLWVLNSKGTQFRSMNGVMAYERLLMISGRFTQDGSRRNFLLLTILPPIAINL